MRMPLKKKYLTVKPKGHSSNFISNNSTPKKRTIWAKLEQSARTGKHKS